MHRADYVIKRAAFAIITVFVAITINFFLFRVLPGDAVRNLSRVPRATEELRHSLEVQFGLDKPVWQQYLIYLRELSRGNMGISFSDQQPVWDNLREALSIPEQYEILLAIALGYPAETVILEGLNESGDIRYYRDPAGVHHVPKRSLDDIIVEPGA